MEYKRNNGGRPKKQDADKRSHPVKVCLTESEYLLLSEKAKSEGMTIQDYLLVKACIGIQRHDDGGDPVAPPVPALNLSWVGKLAHLSTNLNQLTRAANSKQLISGETVIQACYKLHCEIQSLRGLLIGVKP